MFNFNKKLKIFSLVLILLGSIGIGIGFLNSPSNVDEALAMVSNSHDSNYSMGNFGAGYFNTTSAIDAVKFQMSSGNIDSGQILLFGLN